MNIMWKPSVESLNLRLRFRVFQLSVVFVEFDFLSYIFSVSEEYKDYTFDYDDMAG